MIKKIGMMKVCALVVILVSVITAFWVHFALRIPAERNDRAVGLLLEYDEIMRLADGNYNMSFGDLARIFRDAGATGIVIRERILAEFEMSGDILVFSGTELRFWMDVSERDENDPDPALILPDNTFILTHDDLLFEQIFSLLNARERRAVEMYFRGYRVISVNLHSSERATLGMGFPLRDLQIAADLGFDIMPRLRNWDPVTPESLNEVMRWTSKVPNMTSIGFNEPSTPGDPLDPYNQDLLADALSSLNVPLVSFEFYNQRGLQSLAIRLDNYLLRTHAIDTGELFRFSDFDVAMSRYALAATERNIRYIFVRFHNLINPYAATIPAIELVEGVYEGLRSEGLYIGSPVPLDPFVIPFPALFLIGMGVITGGAWLFALVVARYFTKPKWKIILVLGVIGAYAVWGVLLIFAPIFARRVFALFASGIFTSLAMVFVLQLKINSDKTAKRIGLAVVKLIFMSVLTFLGAMVMSSLLSEPVFMVKISQFAGVRVSYLMPLLIIPFVLWIREKDWYNIMKDTLKNNVQFWQLGAGAVLLGAIALYLMRTGNENPNAVLEIELMARRFLDSVLGVRPRTTEFLISHPVTLVLLYYGYKFKMIPILVVGIMGQVSIMNTYAHIHTPMLVSFLRTTHGLWMGIIIGVIAICACELIFKLYTRLDKKEVSIEKNSN